MGAEQLLELEGNQGDYSKLFAICRKHSSERHRPGPEHIELHISIIEYSRLENERIHHGGRLLDEV